MIASLMEILNQKAADNERLAQHLTEKKNEVSIIINS
jgi:hypothetical protein